MNDTPRTNAILTAILETHGHVGFLNCPPAWVAFSKELERELNAAKSKIELLMSANADVARIAGERDAAEKRIRLLIAERDTARSQSDQKHSLRKEFRELLGTDDIEEGVAVVKAMQDRIKRLEEAGDAMFELCDASPIQFELVDQIPQRLKAWEEAKEAKP